jgi:flagellar basal-body rod modification protein FlgD
MTVSAINTASAANTAANTTSAAAKSGYSALGADDFMKLLVTQLQQQDPFNPVDNTAMLAQMAQFSSLATVTEGNATLEQIAAKLDALIAAQIATSAAAKTETDTAADSAETAADTSATT